MSGSTAEEIIKKAEGKKNQWFGLSPDYESASDLYVKAAKQFIMQGDYLRAGDSFVEAGRCAQKSKNSFQASESYREAAEVYLKASSPKYKPTLQLAVQALVDNNRISRAADLLVKSGVANRDMGLLPEALECYQKAEKYYLADGQDQKKLNCLKAEAEIFSEMGQYNNAQPLYEQIAKSMLTGPLKFQAGEFFINAMLCQLALLKPGDHLLGVENCKEQLSLYTQQDVYLDGTPELEILEGFLTAVADQDIEVFDFNVSELARLKKLDAWKTSVLLVVKEKINSIL